MIDLYGAITVIKLQFHPWAYTRTRTATESLERK